MNFESYFVVVEVGRYEDEIAHLMVDGKGVGRAVLKSGSEPLRQGFGYTIGVFPRAGIAGGVKTYRGKYVAKRKEP